MTQDHSPGLDNVKARGPLDHLHANSSSQSPWGSARTGSDTNANNPVIGPPLEGYSLWDASVARVDRYRVTFVVKNITEEFHTTARITSTYIRQQTPRDIGRYFGVTVRANFGS